MAPSLLLGIATGHQVESNKGLSTLLIIPFFFKTAELALPVILRFLENLISVQVY